VSDHNNEKYVFPAPRPKKRPAKKEAVVVPEGPVPEPTRLTLALVEEFVAGVRRGNFRETSAHALGVGKAQIYRWLAVGRKYDEEHGEASVPDKKQFESSRAYSCWYLYHHTILAEGWMHGYLIHDLLSSDSIPAKIWFLKHRFNRLYSNNPNAWVDDETGDVSKIDAPAVILDRLLALLDRTREVEE